MAAPTKLFSLLWGLHSIVSASSTPNLIIAERNILVHDNTASIFRTTLVQPRDQGQDTVFNATAILDKSWKDAELFHTDKDTSQSSSGGSTGVVITCTTCYVKGTANAFLKIDNAFNIDSALKNLASEVEQDVDSLTSQVINYFEDYIKESSKNILKGDFDLGNYALPPLNVDLSLDVPKIPEVQFEIQLDGVELYLALDTAFSSGATYTVSLLRLESLFKVGLQYSFELELELSTDAPIDISSGVHLKLEDATGIDIELFGKSISNVKLEGGTFEFLPVTVRTVNAASLSAVLRARFGAGLGIGSPDISVAGVKIETASVGVEADVFANLAEFRFDFAKGSGSNGCLNMDESYQLAVGAGIGATLAAGPRTWGPELSTSVPIFSTTSTGACATSATSSAAAIRRDESGANTLSTVVTYTATACLSTGAVNCPASLQTTKIVSSTSTYIGSLTTIPPTTQMSVGSTIAFGRNANEAFSTTSSPVPYSGGSGSGSSTDNHRGLIIGLCVGLGVPILAAVVAIAL
ncbi:hypothetical protein GQ53DRAFT_821593 [Thozetella sp. PMI_491]|nr:hypothetical protein GQ53DRAFT_821593 [Thozetella sp. PMI_491]